MLPPKSYPTITSIHTNIKFPNSVVIKDLTPHLFLTGDNGTGKTALINAIELALVGHARDLGGRDKVRAASILSQLMPPGETRLFSYLTLSDGTEASWVMEQGSRPNHQPCPHKVTLLMPEILGAFAGSKLVMARFIIKYFSSTTYMDADDSPHSPAEYLLLEEQARKTVSSWKQEVRVLKSALGTYGANSSEAATYTQKRAQLDAMFRLLSLQVEGDFCKCALCGTSSTGDVYRERLTRVEEALGALGKATVPDQVVLLERTLEDGMGHLKLADARLSHIQKTILEQASKLARESVLPLLTNELGRPIGLLETPSTLSFGFVETDPNTNNTSVHPLLSGAELALLVAVMAQVMIEQPGPYSPLELPLLITPDRGLDVKTLKTMLLKFREIPATTIIQSPTQPRGRPTAGWTRVILHPDYIEVNRDGVQDQVQKCVG